MNFKILILIILIPLFSIGCGVKGPPKAPPGTEITPWVNSYISDATDDN